MTNLKTIIFEDLKQAMRDKNTLTKGVLQIVKAGFSNAEKVAGKELEDAQLLPVIQKEIKQTQQALEGAEKAKRQDLIDQENAKLAILYKYMPAQLSEEEVASKLQELGVIIGMNMGEAMKIAQANLKGLADNKVISQAVKELIK